MPICEGSQCGVVKQVSCGDGFPILWQGDVKTALVVCEAQKSVAFGFVKW